MTTTADPMSRLSNDIRVGSKTIVAQDVELHGPITIGIGTVLHPKCGIAATSGPIVIGDRCIIEESVIIVNRRKTTMTIGNDNLFEVGSRVEAVSVGNQNIFEVKCRVANSIAIGNSCVIGAGCTLMAEPTVETFTTLLDPEHSISNDVIETLPDQTVVYGAASERRTWSGSGMGQGKALHAKHLQYLHDTMPKVIKLKQFDASSTNERLKK